MANTLKVYGCDNLKVVRTFNKEKRCVEYDVMFFDRVFTGRWHSVPRLPTEMSRSRKMADHLYREAQKPIILSLPVGYDEEEF